MRLFAVILVSSSRSCSIGGGDCGADWAALLELVVAVVAVAAVVVVVVAAVLCQYNPSLVSSAPLHFALPICEPFQPTFAQKS